MNQRGRRYQHHNRRQPQVSDHSLSQYHQYHNNNRSNHNGQLADTYSASNHRHPSTTTTTTDRSSISQPQSTDGCTSSICYSYLVAIISSFLVVLGIYFSVTRFNVNYLYISLVGLLFPAVGACIYCISNIRSSRLARRKQWVNSEDFIFNSSSNANNNNLSEAQDRQQQINTIAHILSNRPPPLATTTTTNETNNINTNENNTSAIANHNEPNQRASSSSESTQQFDINDDNPSYLSTEQTGGQADVEANQSRQEDQIDSIICASPSSKISTSVLLPTENLRCQQSPEAISGAFTSTTSLLNNQNDSTSHFADAPADENLNQTTKIITSSNVDQESLSGQLSINMVSQFNSKQLGDSDNKYKKPAQQSISADKSAKEQSCLQQSVDEATRAQAQTSLGAAEHPPASSQSDSNQQPLELITAQNANSSPQSSSGENQDLMNALPSSPRSPGGGGSGLVSSDETSSGVGGSAEATQGTPNKRRNQQQRLANFRRTLVMGISGEEEVIEIDEEDLENMSMVPPSYDSIANLNSRSSGS